MKTNVTYQIPVKAILIVRFENGSEREATDADIKMFAEDIIEHVPDEE